MSSTKIKPSEPLPAPLDQFLAKRNSREDDLATTLLRASETLANAFFGPVPNPSPAAHARLPESDEPIHADFERLGNLVNGARRLLADDPALARQLETLPEAFGEGYSLLLLFKTLFGDRQATPLLRADGTRFLTSKQAQILSDACVLSTREAIAKYRKLSMNTIDSHFREIYRRLEVHTQEEAIARAQSLGYMPLFDFQNLAQRLHTGPRDFSLFQTLCGSVRNLTPVPQMDEARPLAQFGLACMVLAALLGREESTRRNRVGNPNVGALIEIDHTGSLRRRWDVSGLGILRAMTVAPAHAARQGFTPGNLFIVHDQPRSELNHGGITEFTPDGQRVRTFCGGGDVRTRLIGTFSAAFGPDGRLLVTSGWLTDGILAFSAGGRIVTRFADGNFHSLAVSPEGAIVACHRNAAGSAVLVFASDGSYRDAIVPFWQRPLGDRPPGYDDSSRQGWEDVAVDSHGRLLVTFDERGESSVAGRRRVAVMDVVGNFQAVYPLPDFNHGPLVVDRENRIYSPCPHQGRLSILSPDGCLLHHLEMGDGIRPTTIAVRGNDSILVGGKDMKT